MWNREPDPYNIGIKILENTVSLFYIFRNLTGVILANILKANSTNHNFRDEMYVSISPKMNNNVTYPLRQSYILPLINYINNLDITDEMGCVQIHDSTFSLNAWVNHTPELCLPGVSTLTASLSTDVDDNASSVATRVKNLNKIIIA